MFLECLSIPIGSMVLPYMLTFTINIPQMLAYIPYMEPMGYTVVRKIIQIVGISWNILFVIPFLSRALRFLIIGIEAFGMHTKVHSQGFWMVLGRVVPSLLRQQGNKKRWFHQRDMQNSRDVVYP